MNIADMSDDEFNAALAEGTQIAAKAAPSAPQLDIAAMSDDEFNAMLAGLNEPSQKQNEPGNVQIFNSPKGAGVNTYRVVNKDALSRIMSVDDMKREAPEEYARIQKQERIFQNYVDKNIKNVLTLGEIRKMKEQGPIGWLEAYKKTSLIDYIPYVSTIANIAEASAVSNAIYKIKQGQIPDAAETQRLNARLREAAELNVRGLSIRGGIAAYTPEMTSFMGELVLGLGIGGIAAKGLKATGLAARKTLKEGAKLSMKNYLSEAGAFGVKGGVATALVPQRHILGYKERYIHNSLAITDKGQAFLLDNDEKPMTTALKAFADVATEVYSEATGEYIGKFFGMVGAPIKKVISPILQKAYNGIPTGIMKTLVDAVKKAKPNESVVNFFKDKMAFYGILEEFGEERLNALMKIPLGLDERDISTTDKVLDALFPDKEQVLLELGLFSIPGSLSFAGQRGANFLKDMGMSDTTIEKWKKLTSEDEKDAFIEKIKNRNTTVWGNFYRRFINKLQPIEDLTTMLTIDRDEYLAIKNRVTALAIAEGAHENDAENLGYAVANKVLVLTKYARQSQAGKEFGNANLRNEYGITPDEFNRITHTLESIDARGTRLMSVYNALMLEQDFGSQHVKSVLEVTTDFLDMKTGRFDARFESATDKFNKTGRTNNYDGTKKDYGTVRPTDMSSADSVSQEEDTSEKEEAFQAEQDALDSESDNIITEEFERVAGGKIRIPPEDSPMRAEYDALSAQAKKEFFTDNQAAQSIDEVAQNFINAGREVDVFEEIRRIERAKFKSGKYKTKYSVDESESDKSDEIQELLDFVKNLGWAADFPNVTSLSSIDSLRDHKDYAAAKAGNVEAAFNIVYDLFTAPEVPENATAEQKAKIKRRIAQVKARIEKIKEIKRKHPNAILVSVHALEADGKNQIPKQLAIFIGDYLDFEVNNSIGQRNSVKRTGKDKNYRMQKENQPVFDGTVEAGKEYILIDDAVTMGATFGSLNKYIRQNGGTVVDTIAIGTAQFSSNLALNSKTLYTLLTTYNLQDILQVMQEAGLYEKATTTTEITDVNGQRIQGIDRGRQEISGIRAQENRGNEEKGNQSFRLKNEAGLYEEKESSASRRQGADANAAGNSRTQGGFEEISRIRGQEIQGAGNQTDNVDDFQAISFLTESQAREVIKILKNKNLQPTALSALTQLQNSQPNNQNNQYPADSGKGKIKFSDDTSMGNPVDVSSFDAEAKEAVDKALKALSLQIFGDENVITYKNFVDKRGRVIGGFNFKEMIAIAQGKSIPESKFKYFHEAFHRAFNTFLTKEERKQLIDAFIEHSGGIEKLQSDIAKKKKNYSQEDFDVIIEELMADSFAGFSKNYEGFTGKIKLLFEKLLNRIKAFVGNEDKINNFFNNLLSGEFRNQQSVNNSQKTKFQILGEKGAKALDNLDEATYRMDDLQVARDMEKAGKSVNLIRLATGWEKGGDGKWRYEIEDFVFNDEIFLRIKKGELKTARLYELVSDRKQIKQIIRLHNQYGSFPLIKFIDLADGYRGSFLQTQGTITISTNQTVKEMQNTLVHEVQHWLQYHEGFADGSNANNTDTFDEYFKDAGEVEARNASKRIGMNMMQRLATTLAETEDVAEKDKIYLQKSVDNARAFYSVDPLTAGGISERHGNGLTQEQYQQAQKAANAVFKQKMVKFRRNELNYHDNIEVGVMPLFYQEFGLQGLITIQAKKMADIRDKHPDAWAVIDNAMNYIEKPLAVFKSQKAGDSKSVIVLTDINTKTIKDDPAFDGFIFRPQANNTILVSCYSFSQADIERHIAGLKAVDKKRAAELSGLRSTQRALTMPILDNSSGKIDIADLQNNVNNFRASVDEVDDAVDFHTGKPYNPAEPAKSLKDRDIVQEINSDKESFNAAAALMVGADLGLRARTFAGINGRIKAMLEDKTFYIQPDGNAVITGEGLQPILKEAIETLSKKRSKDYNPADYTYGGYNNKAGGNLADEILKDLSDYLIAKRIGDVEKGYTDFYVNDSHKQKFKHDFGRLFDKYGSFDDLEAFAQRIYDFQKRTLELLVHYGVWSKKHFDAVMKRNPHYIPFYRTLDEGGIDDDIFTEKQKRKMFTPVPMGEPQRSATAKIKTEKFNEAPDPIKDIKGGDLDFQDVFSSIIYNTSRIMNSVYRNEIAAGVAKLQDIFPDMIRNFENPKYKDDRIYNLIEYFEKGKKKYVEVTDGLLLAMNGFDSTQTHWLIRFLALPARMLRKGATTLNLAFMPKNIIRDNFEAFLQTNFENENVIKNSQNEIPTIKIKSKVPKFEKVEHLRQWIFDNILPYIKKIVISDNGDIVSVSRDKVRKDLKRKDDIHNQVYSEFKKLFESAKFIRTEPPKAGHNVKGQKVYIINMELNGQSYEVEFRADVPLSEAEAGSLYFAGHKVKALDKGQDFGSEASSSSSQGLDNTLPQKNGSVKKKSPSFIPIYDSVRVLASMIKRDDLYYSFLRSGAAFGSYMELTEKAITEEAEELIKKAYGKNINLNPLRAIETVGEFGEQATRVAVFKRAKEHGMSDIEAALQAREATLDFGRMGEQVKAANQIIPFLNAGIQAADKFLRTFKQHPEMMLIKGLATITLPSLIMSAYYLFFAPDDERNEYLEIPDYQKAQFWHFKAFGQWWKLPKPFTAGRLFGGLPEQFVNFVYRKDSRAAQEIITKGLFELAQSIIPVDDYGASLMPPLIKVAVENITNYNFFMRRNIYPSYLEGYDNFMKYGKNTGEFLKLLGETLDISPALMESAVRGIGGSGAKDINKFLDFVVERFKGMPVMKSELADTLAVNAFAARTPIGYYSNSVQEFFRNYKEAQRKHNTYNKLDSEDDADKTDNYYDKNYKLLDAYEEIKEYYDEIRDITDEIEDVRKDKRLDKNKRFDKIQKLEREMTEVARQANKETEYIFN